MTFDLNKHTARLLMEPFFAALSRKIDEGINLCLPQVLGQSGNWSVRDGLQPRVL